MPAALFEVAAGEVVDLLGGFDQGGVVGDREECVTHGAGIGAEESV